MSRRRPAGAAVIVFLAVLPGARCARQGAIPPAAGASAAPAAGASSSAASAPSTAATAPTAPAPPCYTDATREAGLTNVSWCGSPAREHLLESVGSGAAFVDLDGDGLDDIFVLSGWRLGDRRSDGGPREVLSKGSFAYYHNLGGGRFADETSKAGLGGGGAWGIGVAAGDIDGDGDLDLFVTCFGRNLLYRNRGDGTFEEVGAAAGVAGAGWWGSAAFFDADGDGDLDLYVTSYIDATLDDVLNAERTLVYKGAVQVMVGPFGLRGGADRFYRNRGDGTFEDATVESGLEDVGLGYGLGVVAADFDGDGDLDLYVANDSNPNYLFRNDGGGRFTEIGVVSGAAFSSEGAAQASMGLETADFDGDGLLDLFVTNFADDNSALYKGDGGLFFTDVSIPTKIAALTFKPLSWGTASIDFDQDGRADLVVADGHIYPQVDAIEKEFGFRQRPLLLLNRGATFEDGTDRAGAGFQARSSYRGLAVGDIEGDRDPDLLFTRIDEPPLLLRYDGGDPRRWLVVEASPHPGPRWIGARVDVEAGGRRQSRVILSGGSFASQSALRAVFALGGAGSAERVVVRFPGGGVQEFHDVAGGTTLKVAVPAPR